MAKRIVEHSDDIFPYKVSNYYPLTFGQALSWCEKNCTADFRVSFTKIVFDSEEDAVLFCLSF
jgi:hypothetical protein